MLIILRSKLVYIDWQLHFLHALDLMDVNLNADEEEDEDVHSLRHGTGDRLGSSATKRRSRQIFKSLPKKVNSMFLDIRKKMTPNF